MSEEYYKNRCIKLDAKLNRVLDSHTILEDKIKQYKLVLDEIREYIEKESFHYAYEDDYDIYLCENELEDLLQILDKVKE